MSPEMLLQQFDVMADAPNGVQKLRELILQLAVRGKLVPQDESEEPAGVLLERVAAEKQRLFNEGKIGRPRPHEPLQADEMPYPIPAAWRWVRLSSLGEIVGGGTPRTDAAAYWANEGGIPWLTPADLNGLKSKFVSRGRRQLTESGLRNSSAQLLPRGSVLFSSRAPIGYVAIAASMLATNQGFKSCVPYIGGMSEYIYRFLQAVAPTVDRNAPGTTFREVSGKIVGLIPIPVPPLAEQQRIAARVDELMALCDQLEARQQRRTQARVRLNRSALHHLTAATDDAELAEHWQRLRENFDLLYDTPDTVAELRQAVLQLAVRGRLVPQDPHDEPASVLLERIAAEKQRLYREGRSKKPESLPPIREDEPPFEVPVGWEWVRINTVASLVEYGTSQQASPVPSGVPVLRMNNIQDGAVKLADLKYVLPNIDDLPRLYLDRGDLLFNRTNSYELVGKTGIFTGPSGCFTFASYLIRLRACEGVLPHYLNLVMNSPYFRTTQVEPEITQQTGQANFNGTKLRHTLIPLPPAAEQRRIVGKVDELMALCDRLEARLTGARDKATHLAASVVHHLSAA